MEKHCKFITKLNNAIKIQEKRQVRTLSNREGKSEKLLADLGSICDNKALEEELSNTSASYTMYL